MLISLIAQRVKITDRNKGEDNRSRASYWCLKTIKQRPCWCPKPFQWELNSFLERLPFVRKFR